MNVNSSICLENSARKSSRRICPNLLRKDLEVDGNVKKAISDHLKQKFAQFLHQPINVLQQLRSQDGTLRGWYIPGNGDSNIAQHVREDNVCPNSLVECVLQSCCSQNHFMYGHWSQLKEAEGRIQEDSNQVPQCPLRISFVAFYELPNQCLPICLNFKLITYLPSLFTRRQAVYQNVL